MFSYCYSRFCTSHLSIAPLDKLEFLLTQREALIDHQGVRLISKNIEWLYKPIDNCTSTTNFSYLLNEWNSYKLSVRIRLDAYLPQLKNKLSNFNRFQGV